MGARAEAYTLHFPESYDGGEWKPALDEDIGKSTSSFSGTSLGITWFTGESMCTDGDGDEDMRVSQGLGTRGLSDSPSPNISGLRGTVQVRYRYGTNKETR